MDSILFTIKNMIGLEGEYDVFDQQLIILINAAFFELYQLGVHPDSIYTISDETSTWDDFGDYDYMNAVKEFVYLSVLKTFDPPNSSVLLGSIDKTLEDARFRLMVEANA